MIAITCCLVWNNEIASITNSSSELRKMLKIFNCENIHGHDFVMVVVKFMEIIFKCVTVW